MDFRLDSEQRGLIEVARRFAREEVRPAARLLDREQNPSACYPPELLVRAAELGLRTIKLPREHGGLDTDLLTESMVIEELCAGDVSVGNMLAHSWREGNILARYTSDEQRERFLGDFLDDPTYVTSFAFTEEHSGTDHVLEFAAGVEQGPHTTAELVGDEWVINGRKRWITNGNVARMIILVVRTDSTVPWTEGVSLLLVPSDSPGFRPGRVEDKLGVRLNQNAELIFEDCRVPRANLLGEINGGSRLIKKMLAGSGAKEGAKCLGIGRAAYEEALRYAKQRVQGGRPIIEHGAVASVFADIGIELEVARTMVWRAAWAVDYDHDAAGPLEMAAKVFSGEAAMRAAVRSMELFGSYGISREYPAEKLARDALSMLHAGAGNHGLRTRYAELASAHVDGFASGNGVPLTGPVAPEASAVASPGGGQ